MKNIFKFLSRIVLIASFSFLFNIKVDAMANLNGLSDLTIDPYGTFYNNYSGTSSSIGYQMNLIGENPQDPLAYYVAFPTGSTSYVNGGQGGSIVQCDMSFVAGSYYSVTYYWLSDSMNYYYHPFYTTLTNKLAIGNGPSLSYPTFTYETISDNVQRKLVDGLGYLSAWTVIFKAPQNGTCLLSAFSSNPTSPSDGLGFVGYTYRSLGSSAPGASEIALELNAQFSAIDASLNAAIGGVIGTINSSNADISNKIDDMESSIINNQDKNRQEIIDNENANHQEAENTRKGILGKLGDLFNSIGEWFSNLIDGITEGFTNLFNSIKSLFVGEEVCEETQSNYFTGYTGLSPDSDGWINFETTATDFTFLNAPLKNLEVGKTLNVFVEIDDYSFVPGKNVWFYPIDTISSPQLKSNIQYTHQASNNTFESRPGPVVSCNGLLCNERLTVQESTSYFLRSRIHNYVSGSNSKIKYRILITDDMSMTLNNYEYFTTRKECHTEGGLFGMISSFMSNVGKWFTDLLTGLLDGIKALFVPTDEQLYEIIDDSKELTENFGFVGQSVSFFITIFTSLLGLVNANGCLELPEFSIGQTSLFDSHKFWDKQTVCLNDNTILSSNITSIRTITSIVLVCMFINFAASKFFTILSKNDYANDTSGVDYYSDGDKSYRTEYWTRGTNTFRERRRLK